MDLSIIIVNYNTGELIKQTLASIYKYNYDFEYEVIVIDNASSDGSQEIIKRDYNRVILLENDVNAGFAAASNTGIRRAKGRYILLLNPDTLIYESTLKVMLAFMDNNPRVGAAGCKVVLPDGKLDRACKRSFPTPLNALFNLLKLDRLFPGSKIFGAYNLTYRDENKTQEVDALVGAFMLIKREVIAEAGLLDEDFFLYGEDLDWCYRIKKAGWKIVYYPETEIMHIKGGSSRNKDNKTIREFYRSMYLYYNKHYKNKYSLLTKCIVYCGIWLKMNVSLLINTVRKIAIKYVRDRRVSN